MKQKLYIVAAEKTVDEAKAHSGINDALKVLKPRGIMLHYLTIDPLSTPWKSELKSNNFRSGCAPIEALNKAQAILRNLNESAVVIQGKDFLKTGYSKTERHKLMKIYDNGPTIPDAYDQLAETFIQANRISENDFQTLSKELFENYLATYKRTPNPSLPDDKWYDNVTRYFRGVDCANPVIDFEGKLILTTEKVANLFSTPKTELIGVSAVSTERDGIEHTKEIAQYNHLSEAISQAEEQANIKIKDEFLGGNALLEVYSCYPNVPLAFLLASKIATSPQNLSAVLHKHEITVTGGMNLAKAPWNNPSLNALITIHEKLTMSKMEYAIVHGNGGLGYKQGVAILKRV